jgi:glycosyltransferase involved in cell wall biosynthesis
MRVLVLSTWFPYPPDNGSKIRVYHLLRALSARHEVSLVAFEFGTARPHDATILREWGIDLHTISRDPFQRGKTAGMLRFFSPAPIVTRPLPEMTAIVRDRLRRSTIDAIIASTEVTAAYALMAPNTTVKILEEHNSMSRWMWERYREQRSAPQRLRCQMSWLKARLYEAHLFKQFDVCTMVSEQDRQASLTMLPGYHGPVEVIPNGVDCQHLQVGKYPKRPNTLIYNGALTYSANYDAMRFFLSEVYPLLRRQLPEVSLTVTGSTSGVDRSGLQLDESVHFSGYVEDIRSLVGSSAVCVVPLRQGGGTRLKILEAMALGVPIVSTSKGAEGLDATDGEHLLLADNPSEFAARTTALLRDTALRERLVGQARRFVEQRYEWHALGQKFVEVVEAAADKGTSQR